MNETVNKEVTEAIVTFVDSIHQQYPGISVKPIPKYEDEDFTMEVLIPKEFPIKEVLRFCNKECIQIEDKFDYYIYPDVTYAI